jgi:ABC-2 type transport system ATP-binding protein
MSKGDTTQLEIWTENLTKIYKDKKESIKAVDNINLRIEPGIHGFLGPNGAGKTTTLNMLVGALSITEGEAKIRDFKAGSIRANQIIGFLPQDPQFYDDMAGEDYLIYIGQLGGLSQKRAKVRAQELLEYFDIFDAREREIGKYSGGMKQKIGLAAALIHNPKLLILDEPTANLDPIGRQAIIDKIIELSDHISVLVSSHILAEIEQMADKITMIDKGKILISDTIKNIKNKFIGNTYYLNTDKNNDVLDYLQKCDYITRSWIEYIDGEEYIKINPKDPMKLQKNIPHILIETDSLLKVFRQPEISLQDIFMEIMSYTNQNKSMDDKWNNSETNKMEA